MLSLFSESSSTAIPFGAGTTGRFGRLCRPAFVVCGLTLLLVWTSLPVSAAEGPDAKPGSGSFSRTAVKVEWGERRSRSGVILDQADMLDQLDSFLGQEAAAEGHRAEKKKTLATASPMMSKTGSTRSRNHHGPVFFLFIVGLALGGIYLWTRGKEPPPPIVEPPPGFCHAAPAPQTVLSGPAGEDEKEEMKFGWVKASSPHLPPPAREGVGSSEGEAPAQPEQEMGIQD